MIAQPAKPISPQERAIMLGLDPAAFGQFTMSVAAADAVDRIKKSDRSNWKVRVFISCSWLIGDGRSIIKATP